MHYQLDFTSVFMALPLLLKGIWLTITLSFLATVFGFMLGTLCAIGRRGTRRWLARLCSIYVETIRNTPLLVQVFLLYFGLATLHFRLSAFIVALLALVINVGAYTSEILRAGIESLHKGQIEAAECLGLSKAQIYWHVILRPATERVYPALTSQFVLLMLATSIVSQISAEELMAVANGIQSDTFRSFETYIVVAAAYLGLSLLMRLGLWGFGQMVFPRRRRLGTPL